MGENFPPQRQRDIGGPEDLGPDIASRPPRIRYQLREPFPSWDPFPDPPYHLRGYWRPRIEPPPDPRHGFIITGI